MQKKLTLLRCIEKAVRNEMAASQNPIQGSLFKGNEHNDISEAEKFNSSETSNRNLSNQQLKEDALLRPRIKLTAKNPNQIIDLDEFSNVEIEEPKWSHHNLPKIDDLTPALRHYVELKKENPDRVLLYRLGDFFECFFDVFLLIFVVRLHMQKK